MSGEPAGRIPTPADLIRFIDDLRAADYSIGVAQYAAAQDLLLALTAQGVLPDNPARFGRMLGPLLCHTPEEQDDFQARFERWWAAPAAAPPATHPSSLERTLGKVERQYRYMQWGRLVLVVIASVLFIVLLSSDVPEQPDNDDITIQPTTAVSETPTLISPPDGGISNTGTTELTRTATITSTPEPPIPEPPARESGIDWYWWAGGGALLVLLATFGLPWLFWYYRAHQFLERRTTSDNPDSYQLFAETHDPDIFPGPLVSHMARDLRQRVAVSSPDLDVERTVEASVRQAGWFTPVYRQCQVRPEYLVLVDRTHHRDHQARYVDNLITRLRKQDVLCAVYSFDGDPRLCFPSGGGRPYTLNELAARYADDRLLIFSDAKRLFDPVTGEPEAWLDLFEPWNTRAILTPSPLELWQEQEMALRQDFVVLPATAGGMRLLAESLHQQRASEMPMDGVDTPLPRELRTRPQRWTSRDAPDTAEVDNLLHALRAYLGEQGFAWLMACAVYPVLDWNVTLYLGHTLTTASGEPLFSPQRVVALSRLVWFRHGAMPDWLRERLIAQMEPAWEKQVRFVLQALLAQAARGPVEGFNLDIAFSHRTTLHRLTQHVARIWKRTAPEDGPLHDHTFMRFVLGKPGPLLLQMPEKVARLVQRLTGGGGKAARRAVVAAAVLVLMTVVWWTVLQPIDTSGSASVTPTAQETFTYDVTVSGETTGQRLEDVLITLEMQDQSPLYARTDSMGYAQIIIDTAYVGKPARLLVEAPGFNVHALNVTLNRGALPQEIFLTPDMPVTATPSPSPMPTEETVPTLTPPYPAPAERTPTDETVTIPNPTARPSTHTPTHTPQPTALPPTHTPQLLPVERTPTEGTVATSTPTVQPTRAMC